VAEVPEDAIVEDRSLELEGTALRRLIDAADGFPYDVPNKS